MITVTPEALAAGFTKRLMAEMTAASWAEMLARHDSTTAHCPSHDYCDSNMAMIAALEAHGIAHDASSQDQADLINAAWSLARQSWGQS
jgi:tRNA A37 threonylcarbamoyltransferase TsaD